MNKVFEREFENLRDLIHNPNCVMSKITEEYERIIPMLIRAEEMPDNELISLAQKIKPLVRVDQSGRKLEAGEDDKNSTLVYMKPVNLRQSYLFSFSPEKHIVCDKNDKPIKVEGLKEVGRFICYHRYGGHFMFLRPGVDEVLQQLPKDINIDEISAFEIKFSSSLVSEIYNVAVDRHVSTVILYNIAGGLPQEVKDQSVILGRTVYPCK